MSFPKSPSDANDLSWVAQVKTAADRAAARAVEEHRRAGVPLVFWRDGKVELVSADEVTPPARTNGAS